MKTPWTSKSVLSAVEIRPSGPPSKIRIWVNSTTARAGSASSGTTATAELVTEQVPPIAVSDVLLLLLRPDRQDFQGTAVTIEVARRLGVPRLLLAVNKYAPWLDPEVLCRQVEQTYSARVAGLFAHTDEMLELQSAGVFSLHYPDHAFSRGVAALAADLLAG